MTDINEEVVVVCVCACLSHALVAQVQMHVMRRLNYFRRATSTESSCVLPPVCMVFSL